MYQKIQVRLKIILSLDCLITCKDAQEECAKWNTGVIVDYNTNRTVDEVNSYSDIRPFNSDERNRAKERKDTNS